MAAYYNENDPFAAQWLRNLIAENLIAPGDVDERSIVDVRPDDLTGYTQCHFFAGIGGWSYAARLAGWPDERPLWTGSCPCQPFSEAGRGQGTSDPRHLWPYFYRLIRERRPGCVFGEQVASKKGLAWLDQVYLDMEGAGYAIGALDLCAAGFGAEHNRPRIWFVADSNRDVWDGRRQQAEVFSGALRTAPRGSDSGHFGGDAGQWIVDPFRTKRRFPRDLKPLVDGLPAAVDVLRGAGNAIVPQVAAEVIAAYLEAA